MLNFDQKRSVSNLCPFYAGIIRFRERRFRLLWGMVKFTLILEDFQLSTFDINLPVILSIPLSVDEKNMTQLSPNIGERSSKCIFAPKKVAFSFGKWKKWTQIHHFLLKKKKKRQTHVCTSAGHYNENINIMLVL